MSRQILLASLCAVHLWALGCAGSPDSHKTDTGAAAPSSSASDPAASWVDRSVAQIRVDTGDAGGMRDCKGSFTPEAKAYFTQVYAAAEKCAATGPSPAKGSITFHSTLEEGGGLSEFAVLDDKLGAPTVTACIQEKAMSVDFPKVDPKTPCVQLVHPLSFP